MKDLKNIGKGINIFQSYLLYPRGEIFSIKSGKYLKGHIRGGYKRFTLRVKSKSKIFSAHRLVLENFGSKKPSKNHEVNHIDGNKLNNDISNLQWATRSENIAHAYASGLIPDRRGFRNSNAKLSEKERKDVIKKKAKGFRTVELAEMYDVYPSTIQRIVRKGY